MSGKNLNCVKCNTWYRGVNALVEHREKHVVDRCHLCVKPTSKPDGRRTQSQLKTLFQKHVDEGSLWALALRYDL